MNISSENLHELTSLWRSILPNTIYFSTGSLDGEFPQLSHAESASIGAVDNIRMGELRAGRMHARAALTHMNIHDVDIPMCKSNRTPIWPVSVKGSITHTQYLDKSHVAVAVASSSQYKALGIDAEWNATIHPDMWEYFLIKDELNWIISKSIVERNLLVRQIWCLKEAAIKAAGGGDMLRWRVFKPLTNSQNKDYELSLEDSEGKLKWLGRSAHGQNLTVAVVYVV
jgi:4'-phosphopantetheinyl transferase EntD